MSDLEYLFTVLVVFYLWECTHWLPITAAPFRSWFDGRCSLAHPFFVANSREAGLVFASPLPMGGTLWVTSEWPIAVSPVGVANREGIVARFGDTPRFVARRHRLMLKGQSWGSLSSPAQARWLAGELNRLTAAPESQREKLVVQMLRESLNSRAVAARVAEFRAAARLPSGPATALFLFVFLGVPAVVLHWGIWMGWPWLLGGLVALSVVNAIAFFRAHRKLHPALDDERFAHLLMVLLFPPAGMRARDCLSRPLLERFHPLVVAQQIGSGAQFKVLGSRTVRELRHPRVSARGMNPAAEAIWKWFNETVRSEVEQFVSKNGLSPDACVAIPERSDAECRSYCPRCLAQFTRIEGTCSDCGLALVEFY